MADDFDGDPIDAGEEPDEQPDDGPSAEELAEAEVPGPREEQARQAKEEQQVPDQRDQQIANLNRAIRAEREAKRNFKRQNAELAARQQRSEQRLEVFLQRVAEQTGADISDLVPQAAKLPPEDQDPLGNLKGTMQQLVAPLLAKIEGLEQQLTTRDLNAQVAEVDRYVSEDAAAFHVEHPDYDQAEDVVLEAIARDTWNAAKRTYPNADEDDLADHVGQYVSRAIGNLKVGAYRDRKSLASIIYAVAQQKGWKPGAAAVTENGNGRRPARGKAGELQRNLQKSGAGLTGLERAARKGPVTLGSLADMDDDEFDEYTKDPKRWKKLTEAAAGA